MDIGRGDDDDSRMGGDDDERIEPAAAAAAAPLVEVVMAVFPAVARLCGDDDMKESLLLL